MTLTLNRPFTPEEAERLLTRTKAASEALEVLLCARAVHADETGVDQQDFTRLLGLLGNDKQDTLCDYLQRSCTVLAQRPLTHPLWPAEVISLYDVGVVDRDELLDYLATFPYEQSPISEDPAYETTGPAEFATITQAVDLRRLTRQDYAELHDHIHARLQP